MTPSIDQTLHQFLTLLLIWTLFPNFSFIIIARGFHRIFATGAACKQQTLTPPDASSCPTLGLASVLLSWTCLHPSVLLLCFQWQWFSFLGKLPILYTTNYVIDLKDDYYTPYYRLSRLQMQSGTQKINKLNEIWVSTFNVCLCWFLKV